MKLWRHGDVMIQQVTKIPRHANQRSGAILAQGEITGHSHKIAEPDAIQLWEFKATLYLEVVGESATLVHEEHKPIVLPQGSYKVWIQREYTPQRIRRVVD